MNRSMITTMRGLTCLAALFALCACGILPKKEPLSLYAPEAHIRADPAWPTVQWQLLIPRPTAAELVDSPRIVVRPTPGELQVYKGAIWAQPAPDLLRDTVLRGFEDSGRIAGVARRGDGLAGDYELLLDIRHFESDYGTGGTPGASIDVTAKLIANRSNAVVASRNFRATTAAAGVGIDTVSRAFEQSLSTVTRDIVGWTLVEGQRYDAQHPRPKK